MKKIIAAMIAMVLPLAAQAVNVEVDGINYDVVKNSKTAKVIAKSPEYTGDVVIPSSIVVDDVEYTVVSMIAKAFAGCTGLTSVTMPSSFKSIPAKAFAGCTGLTSVHIPSSIKKISEGTFEGCTALKAIHISDLTDWFNMQFETTVFESGYSLYVNGQEITDLVIPENVTKINSYVFSNCTGITSVTIPSTLKTINGGAFDGCTSLNAVHITDLEAWLKIRLDSNPLEYAHHLYLNGEKVTEIVFPEGTTAITNALQGCTDLVSATLPEGVTEIGTNAFAGCTSLSSIHIPSSLTYIWDNAFEGCTGLTAVHITDLEAWMKAGKSYWGGNPLRYAHHLYLNGELVTEVAYPEGVTYINSDFAGCTDLTSVKIPSTVTEIGSYSFQGCTGLTSIEIPPSVKRIGSQAFEGCTGLTAVHITDLEAWMKISFGDGFVGDGHNPLLYAHHLYLNGEPVTEVVFPEGTREINAYVFQGCTDITSVTIPESMNSIGAKAFAGCTSLQDLYCYSTSLFRCALDAFEGAEGATLYVRNNTLYSREPWTKFAEIKYLSRLNYVIDDSYYKVYYMVPGVSITPEAEPTKEGYTFSGWSEIPETMPDEDVMITGSFIPNQYKITYIVDGEIYDTQVVDCGSYITPPEVPERENDPFSWGEYPEQMPAHDITIVGGYASGVGDVNGQQAAKDIYTLTGIKSQKLKRGVNLVRRGKRFVKIVQP